MVIGMTLVVLSKDVPEPVRAPDPVRARPLGEDSPSIRHLKQPENRDILVPSGLEPTLP
jgi:hypothetical protein